jgi:hypothetical protein
MALTDEHGAAPTPPIEEVRPKGARPAIPIKGNEEPVACPDAICSNRDTVERLWARLKGWRAVATRYEESATGFLGVLDPPQPSTGSNPGCDAQGSRSSGASVRSSTHGCLRFS